MSSWRRGVRLRSGVGAPALSRGERLLAREAMPGGGALIATNHGLHVRATDGSWQRVVWGSVRSVERLRQPGHLQVVQLRLCTPAENLTIALVVRERSRFADLVAELAAAATIVSRRVIMSSSSAVTFSARREPGLPTATWSVEFERDADRHDPRLQDEVLATLRAIRAQVGC